MTVRTDIQILRGIAVLMVVLFHFQVPFFEKGFLGVDLFFVISGFLMAKLFDRGSPLEFYRRRIDRLLPAYVSVVVAVVIAACFLTVPVDFSQLLEQALGSAYFANNFGFWLDNTYFDKAGFKPLLHLWSLAVEIQFYLVVPLLYWLLKKRKALTLFTFALSFAACLVVVTISPKTSFFLMPFRIWEFLIGAWVAWNCHSDVRLGNTNSIKAVSLALLIASFFAVPLDPNSLSVFKGHPGLNVFIVCALTGIVIYTGMPKVFETSLLGKALATLGDYSYSIYLTHFPIIVLINYEEFGGTRLGADNPASVIAAVALTGAASYLSYNLIEKNRSAIFRTRAFRVSLLAAIVVIPLLLNPINSHRFTDEQNIIFSAWNDRDTFRCGKIIRILNPFANVCKLGGEADNPRVLLVGNSHGDAIKTSFTQVAVAKKMAVYFFVANDPLLTPELNADVVIEEARALKIEIIAMHFSNIYRNEKNKKEVERLIKLAEEIGIHTFLIGPTPYYDEHVPKSLYRSHFGTAPVKLNRKQHYRRTSEFRQLAKKLSSAGTPVLDPAEIFCPTEESCLVSDAKNRPYYFDKDHLTLTGAALLEPALSSLLEGLRKAAP